jgi:hypothetical protein
MRQTYEPGSDSFARGSKSTSGFPGKACRVAGCVQRDLVPLLVAAAVAGAVNALAKL